MFTHLDNASPVNSSDPVNRQHPLNRSRSMWLLTLPDLSGGATFYDLMGLNNGVLTAMGNSSNGWRSVIRPGGWGSLLMDGSAGSVLVTSSPSLSPTLAVSCSAWVMYTVTKNTGVVVKDSATGSRSYTMDINASRARFYINGISAIATGPANLVTNVWYHVVGTYDGATSTVYVNGQSVATASGSVTINTGVSTVQVGSREFTGFRDFLQGYLDDASVWTRALSAQEVFELYNLSKAGYPGVLNRIPQQRTVDAATATINALVGTMVATSSLSALISVSGILQGVVSLLNSETGDVNSLAPLSGSESNTSSLSGNVSDNAVLAGALTALSSMSGDVSVNIPLAAGLSDNLGLTVALTNNPPGSNALAGSISDTFTMSGSLSLSSILSGSMTTNTSVNGDVSVKAGMSGSLSDTTALTGSLTVSVAGQNNLVGTLPVQSSLTGNLVVSAPVLAHLIATSSEGGTISVYSRLSGNTSDTSSLLGTLSVTGGTPGILAGQINVQLNLSGRLTTRPHSTTFVTFKASRNGRTTPTR